MQGLFPLRRIFGLETHGLAFRQGLETVPLNGREMHEDILAAVIRGNKPITLRLIKPFDFTCSHCDYLITMLKQIAAELKGRDSETRQAHTEGCDSPRNPHLKRCYTPKPTTFTRSRPQNVRDRADQMGLQAAPGRCSIGLLRPAVTAARWGTSDGISHILPFSSKSLTRHAATSGPVAPPGGR